MVVYEWNVFNYHSTVANVKFWYFQIQTHDFYQSWSEAGHLSTWRAALVRYRGAFPRWLSVLANLSGTARAGNDNPPLQRGNGSSPWQQPKRQEGQGVSLGDLWREKFTWKILQRLSFSASHTINGREWMWTNILNCLSHQPPANNSHISFLNVQKVKRWNIRS